MKKIYADNAATKKIRNNTKEYIISILDVFGNPSSTHSVGDEAKKLLIQSRNAVSNFINANPDDVYFTPSGSASNTLGIKCFLEKNNKNNNYVVMYSPTCHKSILKIIDEIEPSIKVIKLKVDEYGFIDSKYLDSELFNNSLHLNPKKALVVYEYANSEIGTIQYVEYINSLTHKYGGINYLDCTGSISTIKLNVIDIDADMCGFSGHKLGSLKGVGVFYKKHWIEVSPLIYGSQENGISGGTENILSIASLQFSIKNYLYKNNNKHRDIILNYIKNNIPDSHIIGSVNKRICHNIYVCFKNIEGSQLVTLMDLRGIQISTGSACNNGSQEYSSSLISIGLNKDLMNGCVRISLSGEECINSIDYICESLKDCVGILRRKPLN